MPEDDIHILVVDDDARLRDLLARFLSEQGFRITTANDAQEARRHMAAMAFDLLVLDIMMPGETGLELTSDLRTSNDVPILLLTAMTETEDRIVGFTSGADDYLAKPFEPRELVLRINAILKRARRPLEPVQTEISFGDFHFHIERCELRRGEAFVHLTSAEASLLKTLAEQPGTPVSRDRLTDESRIIGNARTIDVQMTRLRRKIEVDPRYPRFLQTVRGTGYVLVAD